VQTGNEGPSAILGSAAACAVHRSAGRRRHVREDQGRSARTCRA